jgi:hypothetical protein
MLKSYRGPLVLASALVALLLWAWLFVAGTVVVIDRGGAVVRAELLGWQGARPLRRLPGGLFVGIPGGDGSVRLRCRDGAAREIGYVTGGLHTWVRVPGREGCAGAREVG